MASLKNPGPLLDSEIIGAVDVIPAEFRANVPIQITTQEVPPDVGADDPEEDGTGLLLESRVIQTRTDERKKTNTYLTKKITDVLVSQVRLRSGQVGTLTRSLVKEGTALPNDLLTEEARQRNLGEGDLDQEVIEAPSVWPQGQYEARIPDVVPEEFRVAVPTHISEETAAGQAATNPVLGTGELLRQETNVDVFKVRRRIVSRSAVAVPATLLDSLFNGPSAEGSSFASLVTRNKTLDNGLQTPNPSFLNLRSEVRNLGNGQSLRETDIIDAFPTLTDNIMDRRTGIISNRVKSIVQTGTANVAGSSQLVLDKFRTVRITETVDAASLAAVSWKFPGTTSVEVPPELTSITVYQSGSASAGNYNESGSYSIGGHGSGGVNLKGHAQGSAVAMYEVGYTTKQISGNNAPCTHILFFANATDSRSTILGRVSTIFGSGVTDWPKFVPGAVSVVLTGGKTTVGLELSSTAYDTTVTKYDGTVVLSGAVRTSGGGISEDVGSSTKSVRFPPTIHGALTVIGGTSFTQSFSAASSISTGANGATGTVAGSATAVVWTPSFVATAGQSTIPTSGFAVHRLVIEPYLPGVIMVHAEVIDWSALS